MRGEIARFYEANTGRPCHFCYILLLMVEEAAPGDNPGRDQLTSILGVESCPCPSAPWHMARQRDSPCSLASVPVTSLHMSMASSLWWYRKKVKRREHRKRQRPTLIAIIIFRGSSSRQIPTSSFAELKKTPSLKIGGSILNTHTLWHWP